MPLVDYELHGHVAVITLNRPEARNAINPEVAVRLADAWETVRGGLASVCFRPKADIGRHPGTARKLSKPE